MLWPIYTAVVKCNSNSRPTLERDDGCTNDERIRRRSTLATIAATSSEDAWQHALGWGWAMVEWLDGPTLAPRPLPWHASHPLRPLQARWWKKETGVMEWRLSPVHLLLTTPAAERVGGPRSLLLGASPIERASQRRVA